MDLDLLEVYQMTVEEIDAYVQEKVQARIAANTDWKYMVPQEQEIFELRCGLGALIELLSEKFKCS